MGAKTYTQQEINAIVLTGVTLFGLAEAATLYFFFPHYYTPYMLLIPAYFLLLAAGLLWMTAHFRIKPSVRQSLTAFMLLTVCQLFTSIALIVCYTLFIDVHRKAFVLLFGTYYAWFLVLKLFVCFHTERRQPINKKQP
jgi:hypothetical protein